jgi:hypothetical protein
MALFVCDKCEYSTLTKQNILKHFNKKNPCSNEILYLNKDKYIKMRNSNNISNENEIFEN